MKNLSAQASAAQLVALFSRFEPENGPSVVYRLLTGRMKGQAFITLPGEGGREEEREGGRDEVMEGQREEEMEGGTEGGMEPPTLCYQGLVGPDGLNLSFPSCSTVTLLLAAFIFFLWQMLKRPRMLCG